MSKGFYPNHISSERNPDMNYQYNQPPQGYPQQQPMYTNEQKKSAFMTFSEKMAEFCNTNSILSPLARGSHITTYILTGFSLVMGIILFFLNVQIVPLFPVLMFFAVLSLSKKNLLPFCIAISYGTGMYLTVIIFELIDLCMGKGIGSRWGGFDFNLGSSGSGGGGNVGGVFNIIFMFVILIVLALIAVIAWMQFAAMLPPRMYAPQGYGQMPPQQGYGQVPPQQGGFQQAAPGQQPPMQPQAPAAPKVCPACGMANDPDSGFCRGCGAKI